MQSIFEPPVTILVGASSKYFQYSQQVQGSYYQHHHSSTTATAGWPFVHRVAPTPHMLGTH